MVRAPPEGPRMIMHAGWDRTGASPTDLEPSGLRRRRGFRHLESRRLIEAGLPARARGRCRLVERGQAQRIGGLGWVESGWNLQRCDAVRLHVGLLLVAGIGQMPERMAPRRGQHEWHEPQKRSQRLHSEPLIASPSSITAKLRQPWPPPAPAPGGLARAASTAILAQVR